VENYYAFCKTKPDMQRKTTRLNEHVV